MRVKSLMLLVLLSMLVCSLYAQEEHSVADITVINIGDGRFLFRTKSGDIPIAGKHRIIDGYRSEYIQAEFADGMYNGKYQRFRNSKLTEEGTYKEGLMDGAFSEYYSDGIAVKGRKEFSKGKPNGTWTTYYPNTHVESEKGYKDGLEHGIERRYDAETGKMTMDCNYAEGKPDGKQVKNMSSNLGDYVEVSYFKMGVQYGDYSETWTNGKLRLMCEYKDGKRDGRFVENSKDGNPVKEVTYKKGKRDGESKIFYTNGSVDKIEMYEDGQRAGLCKEFSYDTGRLKSEYTYADDLKEGAYKLYYEDGSTREEGRCLRGSEVYRKEYYKDGKLKKISERTSRGWETLESYDSNGNQV